MGIDLNTTEGRKEYLSEKLDDLLDGINESYGVVLMEELLSRLELTIKDFNDEMQTLCARLIKKQEDRQHLLEMLRSQEMLDSQTDDTQASSYTDSSLLDIISSEMTDQTKHLSSHESEEGTSLWEKKLAKLEKKMK